MPEFIDKNFITSYFYQYDEHLQLLADTNLIYLCYDNCYL